MQEHIYPIFDHILSRQDKEQLLQQRAKVIWMTGLSGSGKSTLAQALERDLHAAGIMTKLLDGDNVRAGLCNNLGFSEADRSENIRRVAEAARLFLDAGIICICSFVSPTLEIRDLARHIIGSEDFLEVYVNAPLEVCEARDVKGLYKKARAGLIPDFTGISAPFEAPETPFLELRTDLFEFEACRNTLLERIRPAITVL
ncbi:MAG: adenylyl-sulfate kinase [Bacteroidetes bacterium]|nr:MAG: adenylyl-sulfate kinase [Bacteroidota bacterium]